MKDIKQTVFEKYQVRKSKKQKSAFIDFVKGVAEDEGYECRTEQGALGARNIIVGDPDKARVVYTAHYDTCAVMPVPNFITPKNFLIYLCYQILIVALLMLVPMYLCILGAELICNLLGAPDEVAVMVTGITEFAVLIAVMWLIMAGPANKHTANDNTSGVMTLLSIMKKLPQELRSETAFVFFDLEEAGLFGSMSFASKHKKAMKDKLLLNFDCVSDGKTIIFALKKGARKYAPLLEESFDGGADFNVEVLTKGVFYPSDQTNFPAGVGVAALKRSKMLGILYMNRIHTPRDVIYEDANLEFLSDGAVILAERLSRS